MKLFKKVALAAAITLGAMAANATTFDFSYTFDPLYANDLTNDGNAVVMTGSFDATATGSAMSNISNVQLALNGVAFSGPLQIEAYDVATTNWSASLAPVFSSNAALNNFVIADADAAAGGNVSNYFYAVGSFAPTADSGGQVFAINYNVTDSQGNFVSGNDLAANPAAWTLTAVTAPVPEPEQLALLLAGLGLVGAVARRRAQKPSATLAA